MRQFRSFYIRNYPNSLEEAIEYFAVFGGLGWDIDTDIPLMELIEELVLDNYGHLYNHIIDMTLGDTINHALLSGIALGDRRTHSAFKRARISEKAGLAAIHYLCQTGIIEIEPSREDPAEKEYPAQKLKKEIEKHQISDKLNFTLPFMRFWFSFIAPFFKGIQEGDYDKVKKRIESRELSFSSLVFEKLSIELLKKEFKDDPIVEVGSYWDRQVEIDIMAKTASGKIIVGECKYTNTKINKSELTKLKEKSLLAGFEADEFVLFSKRGFSNELNALKNEMLRLYSLEEFKILLEEITPDEKIQGFPKP
ncbi:MAG: ATPase [Helicobacteraceae bacterium]|nr:ATPase [Helicobacteraceae bacterium]